MIRLNSTHSFLNLQQNFSFLLLKLWQIASKLSKIHSNSPTYSVNYAKFAPIINPFILCFRGLPWQRTFRNSSELCKFHAVRPHDPRITQNSHHLLTYYTLCFSTCPGREPSGIPANYANSTQFTHIVRKSREIRTIC